jgi:peptidoglycan L-alanyl-D-glutamate endopeptidase CwlK
MPSATNSTQLRIRFFLKVATLLLYAKFKKIQLLPTCFYRSADEQAKRYAEGRTKPGKIVTYVDGHEKVSYHQKWRAIDFVIVKDGELIWTHVPEYDRLGKFWKKLGGTHGGDWSFKDVYHFQD